MLLRGEARDPAVGGQAAVEGAVVGGEVGDVLAHCLPVQPADGEVRAVHGLLVAGQHVVEIVEERDAGAHRRRPERPVSTGGQAGVGELQRDEPELGEPVEDADVVAVHPVGRLRIELRLHQHAGERVVEERLEDGEEGRLAERRDLVEHVPDVAGVRRGRERLGQQAGAQHGRRLVRIVAAHVVGVGGEHPDSVDGEGQCVVGDRHHQGAHLRDVADRGGREVDAEGRQFGGEQIGVGGGLGEVGGRHGEGIGAGDHLLDQAGGQDARDHRAVARIGDRVETALCGVAQGVDAGWSRMPEQGADGRVHAVSSLFVKGHGPDGRARPPREPGRRFRGSVP